MHCVQSFGVVHLDLSVAEGAREGATTAAATAGGSTRYGQYPVAILEGLTLGRERGYHGTRRSELRQCCWRRRRMDGSRVMWRRYHDAAATAAAAAARIRMLVKTGEERLSCCLLVCVGAPRSKQGTSTLSVAKRAARSFKVIMVTLFYEEQSTPDWLVGGGTNGGETEIRSANPL